MEILSCFFAPFFPSSAIQGNPESYTVGKFSKFRSLQSSQGLAKKPPFFVALDEKSIDSMKNKFFCFKEDFPWFCFR